MSDRHYERAIVLMEQLRYDLAEKELRLALASNPEHAPSHASLSLCLTTQGVFRPAEGAAREAIRLAPDLPTGHYALACTMRRRNMLAPAAAAIREALRLAPDCAAYLGMLAGIRVDQQRWPDALTIAEQGLRAEPDNAHCASMRVMALSYLGRAAEAEQSLVGSLGRDPLCVLTHANRGLAFLREGRSQEAIVVLREALRLDPQNDSIRRLFFHALKGQWRALRFVFAYRDWQVRHPNLMWLVTIPALWAPLVTWALPDLAPAEATLWGLLLVLYVLSVIGFWVADPATDVVLRFDAQGRHALTRAETVAGGFLSVALAAALAMAAAGLLTRVYALVESSILLLLVCLPLSSIGKFHSRRARWVFCITICGLAAAAFVPLMRNFAGRSEIERSVTAFLPLAALTTHIAALVVVIAGDRAIRKPYST